MARALQLRATGEGVEEPAQLRFLENHRCEEVQGFLLCRPLPADDCLRELLRAQAAADAAHGGNLNGLLAGNIRLGGGRVSRDSEYIAFALYAGQAAA